jgi:hypothetical protein
MFAIDSMIRMSAPHFCAGVVLEGGRAVSTALGWTRERIERYCAG